MLLLETQNSYYVYQCKMTSIPSLLGSHLSELHLSKHIGYLNMLSKATPTIFNYFHQQEASLNHQYGVFQCLLYWL